MPEQIITDGVDVSGCEFFELWEKQFNREYGCLIKIKGHKICKNKNDCYYKQLQRLKAEIDELKEKHHNVLNLAKISADTSEYCMRELEKQNEELKIQNESLRNHISDLLQQLNDLKEAQNAGS